MIKKLLLIATAVSVSLLSLESAFASGSMRCGTHIISSGQRNGPGMYEVQKKCGQPTDRIGNTWIYQRGSTKNVIHFNSAGAVTRIE